MRSPTENEDYGFRRVACVGRRVAFGLVLLACMVACQPRGSAPVPVIVASSDSPEQLVIGKMTVLALRAAGYEVIYLRTFPDYLVSALNRPLGAAAVAYEKAVSALGLEGAGGFLVALGRRD